MDTVALGLLTHEWVLAVLMLNVPHVCTLKQTNKQTNKYRFCGMHALPDRPTTMTAPVLAAAARLAGALSAQCIVEATAMLAAMAARASKCATPGPARCHCTVLGFMARAGSMQVA